MQAVLLAGCTALADPHEPKLPNAQNGPVVQSADAWRGDARGRSPLFWKAFVEKKRKKERLESSWLSLRALRTIPPVLAFSDAPTPTARKSLTNLASTRQGCTLAAARPDLCWESAPQGFARDDARACAKGRCVAS